MRLAPWNKLDSMHVPSQFWLIVLVLNHQLVRDSVAALSLSECGDTAGAPIDLTIGSYAVCDLAQPSTFKSVSLITDTIRLCLIEGVSIGQASRPLSQRASDS